MFYLDYRAELAIGESALAQRYGWPPLSEILPTADRARIFGPGGTLNNFDLRELLAFKDRLRAACDATEDYWRKAQQFTGSEQIAFADVSAAP